MHPQSAIHRQSLEDPESFWLKAAADIHWHAQPAKAYGQTQRSDAQYAKHRGTWFPGAQRPLADRIAFHHISPLPFQKKPYRAWTYGQVLEHVQTLAGVLLARGVRKGDAVVIYMPMIPETAMAMLACARIGAVHSVVFGGFAARELAKRIQDSRCVMVLSASCGLEPKGPVDYKPLVDGALQYSTHKPASGLLFLRRHTIAGHTPAQCAAGGGVGPGGVAEWDWEDECERTRSGEGGRVRAYECTPVGSEDPAYTLYTSGTTGMPKGVVRLTGGHAVALRYVIEHAFGMRRDDTMLCASDLGWVVGHSFILYGPLLLGAATCIFEGKPVTPDAGILWRTVSALGVTHLFTAPTALRAVRGLDPDAAQMRAPGVSLRTLRTLFLAGERSEPQLVRTYAELLAELAAPGASTRDNYWSTESGSPITALAVCGAYASMPPRPGSAGLPMPGMDVRIVDDDGAEVEQGAMGNLVLKTPLAPSALGGLWNNAEGFHKSYFERFTGRGDWFETGDQGVVDADGYVTILARSDDIINVSAHRLGTGLIEQVVTGHSDVVECCVVGAPDAQKGQTPFALLVPASSSPLASTTASSSSNPDASALLRRINDHIRVELGPIAQLGGLVALPRLPKTRSGKTLRKTVRRAVENAARTEGEEQDLAVPPTIEDPDVVTSVVQAVKKHFDTVKGKAKL